MTTTERTTILGTALGLITVIGYWAVVIFRAATDDLPLADVAWEGPMLAALVVGGGLYAITYGAIAWRARGTLSTDARDHEIQRYADGVVDGNLPCVVWVDSVTPTRPAPVGIACGCSGPFYAIRKMPDGVIIQTPFEGFTPAVCACMGGFVE